MSTPLRWAVSVVVSAFALLILIALLLPPYGDYTPRAKMSEVILGTSDARTQVEEFYAKHKRLPRDAAEAGVDGQGSGGKIHSLSYDGPAGELRAVVQNVPEANGKVLKMTAKQL